MKVERESSVEQIDALLAAILRGASVDWTPYEQRHVQSELVARAMDHGVISLVWHQMGMTAAGDNCPTGLAFELKRAAAAQAVRHELMESEVCQAVAALAKSSIVPIVFKGAALAHTHYPSPSLRNRTDTDLLIRDLAELTAVENSLAPYGWKKHPHISGGRTCSEALFWKEDSVGLLHQLDVHWRISNRPHFARLLSYDEIASQASPNEILSGALTPSDVHSLLLACIHRLAHHDNARDLVWLYDVTLLAKGFSHDASRRFVDLARTKGLSAVAFDGLQLAGRIFGEPVATSLSAALADGDGNAEATAAFLTGGVWKGDVALSDFWSQDSWRNRFRFALEVVFPDPEYMMNRYEVSSPAILPLLYVRRLALGLWNLALKFPNSPRNSANLSVSDQ